MGLPELQQLSERVDHIQERIRGQIGQFKEQPQKRTRLGLVVILALFVGVILYASFGQEIAGQAIGDYLGDCAPEQEGKYFRLEKDGTGTYVVGKCVESVIMECEEGACPQLF